MVLLGGEWRGKDKQFWLNSSTSYQDILKLVPTSSGANNRWLVKIYEPND